MTTFLGARVIEMHQGGWDEIASVVVPIIVIVVLIIVARRRRPAADDTDEHRSGHS